VKTIPPPTADRALFVSSCAAAWYLPKNMKKKKNEKNKKKKGDQKG
jgi:hypothetical protein